MLTILNNLNGSWSDSYIWQTIIQEELQNLTKNALKKLDFKCINFQLMIRDIHKIEKRNSISISVLVFKTKKNIQFVCQKNVLKIKHMELLLIEEEGI